MSKPYNVVLSGGGTRGYAHIGVLEALREKGLALNAISATSAGALVGVFICDGFHPAEIREMILHKGPKVSFSLPGFGKGLISISAIKAFISKNLRSRNFEQLGCPLYVTATDLVSGKPAVFNEGPILDVLLAASAIPVLFKPVTINGIPYADGGISSNLPAEPFYNSPHSILGVHVNPFSAYNAAAPVTHLMDRSVHMALRTGIHHNIQRCHVFIEPPELAKFHLFENGKTAEIIRVGYEHALRHVELED